MRYPFAETSRVGAMADSTKIGLTVGAMILYPIAIVAALGVAVFSKTYRKPALWTAGIGTGAGVMLGVAAAASTANALSKQG